MRKDDDRLLEIATTIGRVTLLSEEDIAVDVAAGRAVAYLFGCDHF